MDTSALSVVEARWIWYRRRWRISVFSTVLQPMLFLVALGVGFGALVPPSAATGGREYLAYLAPALLAASAMQNAVIESTYPILSHFKYRKTYHAMTATPLTPSGMLGGELVWITLRLCSAGLAYLLVALLLGAMSGPGAVLALGFAVLTGLAVAPPLVAYAASITTEGPKFGPIVRFIVLPMTLFAGTFFPVSLLPGWAQPIVWCTPLWHGTELARGAAFGTLRVWPALGHIGYLIALGAVGVLLAARYYRRRLRV
jgi:lipooligosaccharide transport system permease protein